MAFKYGSVAFIGQPNVGKSTLMNALLGEDLAIVTPKPQTTRHRIVGILNRDDAQIVFLDTPGFHESSRPLNVSLIDVVEKVIHDADVICMMIEPDAHDPLLNRRLIEKIDLKRTIVVINKADTVSKTEFEILAKKVHEEWGVREVVVLSALHRLGIQALMDSVVERLPEGEPLYPVDSYTIHSVRFLTSEIIREQVFLQMQQEIPYSTRVEIEEFRDAGEKDPITRIRASIIVERESQKGMVIGQGGKRIKEIGKRSRQKIEALVGTQVFLGLEVQVDNEWTKNNIKISKLYEVT